MKRIVGLALTMGLSVAGCRAAAPLARPVDPDLQLGALAHRTGFELDQPDGDTGAPVAGDATPAEEGPAPPPAQTSDSSDTAGAPWPSNIDRLDSDKDQRLRNALYWSGIGIMSVGLVGTVGLMTGGQIAENRLDDGYDGELSRERERRLRDAGTLTNQLAIASGGIAVLGLALLLVGYGLDYSVCGKLAKRRKKCRNR